MLQKLPQDGMLVHHRSLPRNLIGFPNTSPVPIYSHGWREALWELSVLTKNTLTKCPRPELQHGPLAPGTSALIMRPLRVHITTLSDWSKKRNSHYFLIQSGVKRALDALANVFPRFSATHVYLLQCFISSVDYLDLLRLTSLISTDFFFWFDDTQVKSPLLQLLRCCPTNNILSRETRSASFAEKKNIDHK